MFFGKRAQELLEVYGDVHEVITLPCGKCVSCMLKRAEAWAIRCMHEASFFDASSFLTLTYDDAHLPPNRTLVKEHVQGFLKRLRINLLRTHGVSTIRYFAAGEYGERKGRPHYHMVLYGWDFFDDRLPVNNNPGAEFPIYESKFLTECWGHGRAVIGELSGGSAAYVARYTLNKIAGEAGKTEYERSERIPPFNLMSKGIGARWLGSNYRDVYADDCVIDEDSKRKRSVPRFYDKLHAVLDAAAAKEVKERRIERTLDLAEHKDMTPQRLKEREAAHLYKLKQGKRRYESSPGSGDPRREASGISRDQRGEKPRGGGASVSHAPYAAWDCSGDAPERFSDPHSGEC